MWTTASVASRRTSRSEPRQVARAGLDVDRLRDALESLGRHVQLVRARLDVLRDDRRSADELTIEEHLRTRDVGLDAQRPELRRAFDRRGRRLRGGRCRGRRGARGAAVVSGCRSPARSLSERGASGLLSPGDADEPTRNWLGLRSLRRTTRCETLRPTTSARTDDNDENASVHH